MKTKYMPLIRQYVSQPLRLDLIKAADSHRFYSSREGHREQSYHHHYSAVTVTVLLEIEYTLLKKTWLGNPIQVRGIYTIYYSRQLELPARKHTEIPACTDEIKMATDLYFETPLKLLREVEKAKNPPPPQTPAPTLQPAQPALEKSLPELENELYQKYMHIQEWDTLSELQHEVAARLLLIQAEQGNQTPAPTKSNTLNRRSAQNATTT
jgi:hypothetical protein